MSSSVRVASRLQIAKESVRGTTLAAVRRMQSVGTVTRQLTQERFENEVNGSLALSVRAPLNTAAGSMLRYGPVHFTFEEILVGLLGGMKGGVTPVGAGADKTWTFLPGDAADPAPDTYTWEWVESDLVNNYEFEAGYGIVQSFEVSATPDGVPQLTINLINRAGVESTMTGAIALPVLKHSPNALWDIRADASWAGLGGTVIASQPYAFRYKFNSGIRGARYLDARAALDFSKYEYGSRWAELEIDTVIDAAAGSLARIEMANRDTPAMRFYELRLVGPTLGAGTYLAKLQGAYYHAEDSLAERGRDRDGNLMTTIKLRSAKDVTSGNDVQAIVVNALTTFP